MNDGAQAPVWGVFPPEWRWEIIQRTLIEKGIVRPLFTGRCDRPMPRAEQCFLRKGEDLFFDFLLQQISRLQTFRQSTGKDCVTDNGDMWRILGPIANHVNDSVFCVAWKFTVGDSQTPKRNEIVSPIAMLRRSVF